MPTSSGENVLYTTIQAVHEEVLEAGIIGISYSDVDSQVTAIEPEDLSAYVSGYPAYGLSASIVGFEKKDLLSSVHGYLKTGLDSTILGIGKGQHQLYSIVEGYKGINQIGDLTALLTGVAHDQKTLQSSIEGYPPAKLSGSLVAVPPSDLDASIHGLPQAIELAGTISGELPPDIVTAEIYASGGFSDIVSMVRGGDGESKQLPATIDGQGIEDLFAKVNAGTQSVVGAEINSIDILGLRADIIPTVLSELNAEYTPIIGNLLGANIDANAGNSLNAIIAPKVIYIDSSIPLNTYPFSELKAVINASDCDASSSFKDLSVIIEAKNYNEISASYIGIGGQLAISEDEVQILLRNGVLTQDWIPMIIEYPRVVEAAIPIILTNSPLSDLSATIVGVHDSLSLEASIESLYYGGVARSTNSIIEWVNTKTGERKIVRVTFLGDFTGYYFSEAAGTSFSFSPEDRMEIVVESYEPTDNSETVTMLSSKGNVKRCFVDNLQEFSSLDEAVKFAIMCSTSQIQGTLGASITAIGDTGDLSASVSGISANRQFSLGARYTPVANQPILDATISGSGGYSGLSAFIRGVTSTSTSIGITNTLGERFVPKLITHGINQVSIVLTKVISTDTMVTTSTPGLAAEITGVAATGLTVTISGTP